MTIDLETRLQSMGGALRDAVSDVPDRTPRRPGGGARRVAVGVPLLVLAVVATLFVVRSNGPTPVDSQPVSSLRGLVADSAGLPAGLQLSWAGQQAADSSVDAAAGVADAGVGAATDTNAGPVDLYTYLYGDTSGVDPFAANDLVVNVWKAPAGVAAFDPTAAVAALKGATQATVQGQGAVAADVPASVAAGGQAVNSLRWETQDGVEALLASHSAHVEQLQQIADGLRIKGTNVVLGALPPELAGKLVPVANLSDRVVNGARQVAAHWVGYTAPATVAKATRAVDVTTLTGGKSELSALLWSLHGTVEQVDVRGGQGYLAADAAGKGSMELVWQEEDGVLARVTSVGLSKDEVLAVAKKLRWTAKGEWNKVQDQAEAAAADAKKLAEDALKNTPTSGEVTTQGSAQAAGTDAGVTANRSGSGGDVTAQADTPLSDLESTLHAVPGADAVLGPVTSTLNQGANAVKDAGSKVADKAKNPTPPTTKAPGLPLLP